jgi:hypothetical protein
MSTQSNSFNSMTGAATPRGLSTSCRWISICECHQPRWIRSIDSTPTDTYCMNDPKMCGVGTCGLRNMARRAARRTPVVTAGCVGAVVRAVAACAAA